MNNSINPLLLGKDNARNQQWTQEENATLRINITEKNCDVVLSNSEEFWQSCAIHLSEMHACFRIGILFRISLHMR